MLESLQGLLEPDKDGCLQMGAYAEYYLLSLLYWLITSASNCMIAGILKGPKESCGW